MARSTTKSAPANTDLMAAFASFLASQGMSAAEAEHVEASTPTRTNRKAASTRKTTTRRTASPAAAHAPRRQSAEGEWTVSKSWKGQDPTSGILWRAYQAGIVVDPSEHDKYDLSVLIGKAEGLKIVYTS